MSSDHSHSKPDQPNDVNHDIQGPDDDDQKPENDKQPLEINAPFSDDDAPPGSAADPPPIVAELIEDQSPFNASSGQLGRLHPLSIFFDIASHIRTFIIPAIIALFSAASGSDGGLILAAFIFFPTLISSFIRYFSLRYSIQGTELVVTEGIFFHRIRTVPVERIQNIDLIQNVLHRFFAVTEVRIETASGTEAEATLRVLSMSKVEELRAAIFTSRRNLSTATKNDVARQVGMEADIDEKPLLTIPSNLLIRAGLASNKGTLLLGVLIGLFFQFNDQFEQYFDPRNFFQWFNQQYDTYTMIFLSAVSVILILLFFRLLGVAWYLLRFSGYRLVRHHEDLRIQCGLFTKVSATVPRKRIQFISIHRNLVMRWMNLAAIRIETAGAAGNGVEDAAKTVSSRWFIPVVPEHRVKDLIEELKPGLDWDESNFDWRPISPLAPRRTARLAVVSSIVIAAIGLAVTRPWGWLAGVVAMPLLIWAAVRKAKSRRYARSENVILYRSGILYRKTSLTFFEKIQTVYISETPFDRRWKMATLCIDTAAAGPADHVIHIDYLEEEFAKREFDAIVERASDKLPVFG